MTYIITEHARSKVHASNQNLMKNLETPVSKSNILDNVRKYVGISKKFKNCPSKSMAFFIDWSNIRRLSFSTISIHCIRSPFSTGLLAIKLIILIFIQKKDTIYIFAQNSIIMDNN